MTIQPGNAVYECNSLCSCGPDCRNRVVQDGVTPLKGMEYTIFMTENKGWGVKSSKVLCYKINIALFLD